MGNYVTENVSETNQHYAARNPQHVYPVEFVVRTFLGSYPNLQLDKTNFAGSRILDLGYGDGRNMPLLFNLGFEIYGVEISDEINKLAKSRLKNLGVAVTVKKGRNASVPFGDSFFQYVLACHSCYYIDEGTTFENSLNEIYRILDHHGIFICSLPMHDTYILEGAEQLPGGYYRITYDPYNYRNGTVFRAFKSSNEILNTFDKQFEDIRIGFCDDDFFGIRQKVWTVVCKKR
jgi:SAM-dependent methyltransferase